MLDRRAHVVGEHAAERVAERDASPRSSGRDAGENSLARLLNGERHSSEAASTASRAAIASCTRSTARTGTVQLLRRKLKMSIRPLAVVT